MLLPCRTRPTPRQAFLDVVPSSTFSRTPNYAITFLISFPNAFAALKLEARL